GRGGSRARAGLERDGGGLADRRRVGRVGGRVGDGLRVRRLDGEGRDAARVRRPGDRGDRRRAGALGERDGLAGHGVAVVVLERHGDRRGRGSVRGQRGGGGGGRRRGRADRAEREAHTGGLGHVEPV